MNIDWQSVLGRYMKRIIDKEGISYVTDDRFATVELLKDFSAEELAALRQMARELGAGDV